MQNIMMKLLMAHFYK